MEEKKYCIYYHKSPDGKYYIGQTCQLAENRWKNGTGYNTTKFNKQVIVDYGGWDAFEHGILIDNLTAEEADEKEAYFIKLYDAVDNGFNSYQQNYSGYHFADLWNNEEIKQSIIKKLTEQRNTPEYHEQQSAMMKSLWETKEYQEAQAAAWTEERRQKTSERSKQYWKDENYRKRISEAVSMNQKERWKDPEYRKKRCKQVQCIETGEIFESLKAAADWCGVKSNTLCSALSSKTHQSGSHPVTGQKLHWRRYPPEVEKEGSGI